MLKPFLLFFEHPLSLFLYGISLSEYQTKKCTLILRSYPERETLVGFDVVSYKGTPFIRNHWYNNSNPAKAQ